MKRQLAIVAIAGGLFFTGCSSQPENDGSYVGSIEEQSYDVVKTQRFCDDVVSALETGRPQELLDVGTKYDPYTGIESDVRLAAADVYFAVNEVVNGGDMSAQEQEDVGFAFGTACAEAGAL